MELQQSEGIETVNVDGDRPAVNLEATRDESESYGPTDTDESGEKGVESTNGTDADKEATETVSIAESNGETKPAGTLEGSQQDNSKAQPNDGATSEIPDVGEDWEQIGKEESECAPYQQTGKADNSDMGLSLRDEEVTALGGEVIFPRAESEFAFGGWDNLRWMAFAGVRKVQHSFYVEKLVIGEKKGLNIFGFGSPAACDEYHPRKLVIYEDPSLILLLRPAKNLEELQELVDFHGESGPELSSYLIVDAAVEPRSCKLRLSPLTTPTSVSEEDSDAGDFRRSSCFHLLTPTGTIAMTAIAGKHGVSYTDSSAFLEATTIELAISKAICQAHSNSDINSTNASWTHQMILGSLHSFVVSGSQRLLEKAIVTAMRRSKHNVTTSGNTVFLQARIVDRVDDKGLTPLHYACSLRFSMAVAILVKAGARTDIRTDLDMTPLHLCAQNVDHKSLSILLAANFPVKPNANALDSLGRTPMYLAATEGKGQQGQSDAASLGRCIMALEAWGGKMFADRSISKLRMPQSVLAAQWRCDEMSEVLRHSSLRFPLPGDLLRQQAGTSIGAFYQYPLHSALMSLIKEIQSFYDAELCIVTGPFSDPRNNALAQTVLTLLNHGFEPNERMDRLSGPAVSEFEEFVGFAPIQIIACAALEADNLKGRVDEGLLACILKVLVDTCDALVRNGARLSLDVPPTQRLFAAKSDSNHSESDGPIIDAYDRTSLKVDSNKKIVALLGGNDKLNASKKAWQELKATPTTCHFSLPFEHESAFSEKLIAGGSSEKSCAICWSEFGSIMNRKHRCRVSQRFVCDDCSSKRVLHDGKEVRLSDGQFAVARADLATAQRQEVQRKRDENEASINKMKEAHEKVRQARVDEEAQRESLFGSMLEKAATMLAGEEEAAQPASAVSNQIDGLTDSLNQTRNALLDRGQKLDSLGEKTSKMVDSSAEFAKMTKELQRQSESGFFW